MTGQFKDMDPRATACKSCGEPIVWLKTKNNKNIPVDADTIDDPGATVFNYETMTTHFETCKDASKWRRK